MKPLVKKGSTGRWVRLVQEYLGINVDGVFGPKTLDAVKAFQVAHGLTPDGKVGENTWVALELYYRHMLDRSIVYIGPIAPLAQKIQSVIDVCHSGKVGYYKNPISDVARLKLPVGRQFCAAPVKSPSALWGTLTSIGTCNMAQEFIIALLSGVPPRIGANGSTKRWEGAWRRNQSGLCGVDMVGPCTGYDAKGKPYPCHGGGQFFQCDGRRDWDGMIARMRNCKYPYAVFCLDGGHVIGLHLSDYSRGWVYYDPATGALVEDGAVLVLAADGVKAKPGQPTTILQRAEMRRSQKSGWLYVWVCDVPDDGIRAVEGVTCVQPTLATTAAARTPLARRRWLAKLSVRSDGRRWNGLS
jgi:hypothetical protein